MTRIDFYVLDDIDERRQESLVCRLAEKAWRAGHQVHICCDAPARANALDKLLWSYKDTSFLPHALLSTDTADETPIIIGNRDDAPLSTEVLINLSAEVPDYFSRFERVMETTGHNDTTRSAARERYRYYQERGYPLNTHKLDQPDGR